MSALVPQLIEKLNNDAANVEFDEVIAAIAATYVYTPRRFHNGDTVNEAGTNEGSCKIFAFARLQNLSPEQTLACFGKFYRDDVLENPKGTDHANIRQFMQQGWDGIRFEGEALATSR